ncbi:MAG: HlyD family efflux transporter periplasmic adaptor subunit [bacterium]|nr:HlyD family efflux transporter periplasmic adaptor subunit [bacterium]
MDVARTGVVEQKRRKRWMLAAAATVAVVLVTVVIAGLEPAAPSVDRDTLWIGTVEQGEMLRQVRGHGTLVPENIRWIPAPSVGTIERIAVQPGAQVQPEDILLELSNPEVEQAALDAVSALKRAEAEYESLRVTLLSQELNHQANAAEVEANFVQASLNAEANRELAEKGLISSIHLRASEAVRKSITTRRAIEEKRLAMTAQANAAQLDAKRAEVDQQRGLTQLRIDQLESLKVRSGLAGVLQQIPVEIGQQVMPGFNLARVADPTKLQAELRVPATQAKDLRLGQKVMIDTRNGIVPGTLARIDPAVRDGSVAVDVRIDAELPQGARPDLTIDGTVEIERLENVLYVGRPVHAQEDATIGLFRLDSDEKHATRITIRLGKSSVSTVEVVEGLQTGDQVVLSDTSRWDDYDRIRLK